MLPHHVSCEDRGRRRVCSRWNPRWTNSPSTSAWTRWNSASATTPTPAPTPCFMRGPGEAPGLFALESAMDELAVDLGMDPLELRIRNHADA
ncbi:molybdopterin cofactor-binding domain-containing protein, partial [Mycolicibacterium gadium]|uniref:molybdopterin cofactor-binding domain-containing protein n=1 Tax=Mycolicibacterium gadium TaxID=1794 RepID=UPI0027E326E2